MFDTSAIASTFNTIIIFAIVVAVVAVAIIANGVNQNNNRRW